MMLQEYKMVDGKKMRMGYTTGTCAAMSAKAATLMLLTQQPLTHISAGTKKGIALTLPLHHVAMDCNKVSCSIQKDAGDDPDVTHGIFIYATVEFLPDTQENVIEIDGGVGIGRVTKPGLNQPVGAAAINSEPRKAIQQQVQEVLTQYGVHRSVKVLIWTPEGQEIAQKTFNPRLGIVGGISILGTSGIVEPMSDDALIQTIKTEIDVRKAQGEEYLIVTPGNYGKDFIDTDTHFKDEHIVKCSNFIGVTLDYAAEKGFKGVLLVAHGGKMVKLAGGLFNTHSRYGDCRGEIICANAALCGADLETLKRIMESVTVDEMLAQIQNQAVFADTIQLIMDKIYTLCNGRNYQKLWVEGIMYTQKMGRIAQTPQVAQWLQQKSLQEKETK